jgi:hypothetical protein
MPRKEHTEDRISKDEMLENAILSSISNPRHCLYYREPSDPNVIAKTLINSNETYELKTIPEYATSIHAHEQIHIVSTNQTQFKRIILLNSLCPPLERRKLSTAPVKITSYKPTVDFLLLYNSEVIPYLEAFALLYQCRLRETPYELKEALIDELSIRNPAVYGLIIDIEDVFERILEKNKSPDIFSAQIYALIANLVFSSSNIVNERVFDRFRLLREVEGIPEWKTFNDIVTFFSDHFHKNNQNIIITTLGTAESIVETAQLLRTLKELAVNHSVEIPKAFLFGILSEVDIQIGRISYFVDDLETLEGKRINRCYIGDLAKTEHFLSALKVLFNNSGEMLQNEKYKQHRDLLIDFRKDVAEIMEIKKRIFQKCPGSKFCKNKAKCLIKGALHQEITDKVFPKK